MRRLVIKLKRNEEKNIIIEILILGSKDLYKFIMIPVLTYSVRFHILCCGPPSATFKVLRCIDSE